MHPVARLAVLPIAALLLLGACGTEKADDAAPDDARAADRTDALPTDLGDLAGRTLVVTGITVDGEPREVAAGTQVRFAFAATQLHIDSGCNGLGGTWDRAGDTVTVGPLMGTMMACDPDRMAQEDWLRSTLEKPLTVGDGTLTAGDVVFSVDDRERVSPDLQLSGHRWQLDSLIDDQAVSSVPRGVKAWLEYDGTRLRLKGPCNDGTGTATFEDGTLTISDLSVTELGCVDDRGEVERQVLAVLTGKVGVEIVERRLTLTSPDGTALGFTAAD
ncbi:META domain-containing protein [Nocardioides daejeonensis]|uniref:META domain-containing protein n=1 Tax=Nocardioides daejeonensis TaxID=1046556 RepID=UPI000D74AAB0|nr:META domain-containing protein [Nocardioides daejeonensis]